MNGDVTRVTSTRLPNMGLKCVMQQWQVWHVTHPVTSCDKRMINFFYKFVFFFNYNIKKYIYSNKVFTVTNQTGQLIDMWQILNISSLVWFEPVWVSIFIMMNWTKPEQAVQSGSVQSSLVHWFMVWFMGSEVNHANTMNAWWIIQKKPLVPVGVSLGPQEDHWGTMYSSP